MLELQKTKHPLQNRGDEPAKSEKKGGIDEAGKNHKNVAPFWL
jgi:hypothetical protein